MVKDVDLERGIIYGTLKQIRTNEANYSEVPSLVNVWYCDIPPAKTQIIVSIIRDYLTDGDCVGLTHVKRFKKVGKHIRAILCSFDYINDRDTLLKVLKNNSTIDLEIVDCDLTKVPLYPPKTKEIAQKWSSQYWPMAWKGNPNHQFLNSIEFNMHQESTIIATLLQELEKARDMGEDYLWEKNLVTLIAKESGGIIQPVVTCLNRGWSDPSKHGVMMAIDCVARLELNKRQSGDCQGEKSGYLCHNMIVYTTHEPCVMCCMALVHSRIARIVYLTSSPSGGLESNYQLGDRDGLNWKFQIWKWVGNKELQRLNDLNAASSAIIHY